MEEKTMEILSKVLTKEELKNIPNNVCDKVEKYVNERFEELLVSKALGESARNSLDDLRQQCEKLTEELSSNKQDFEAKITAYQSNVNELRAQLNLAREENSKLQESNKKYEDEIMECRRAKHNITDERDSLLKIIERRTSEVERLQSEIKSFENNLKSAITAKCEAITKYEEIQSKEIILELKEKRMDQDRTIFLNQIQVLTNDLDQNNVELQEIRRENTARTLTLETKLSEKLEELKIANNTITRLNENVQLITSKAEDLATKLLVQSEESVKLMDHFKKELQAKTKLAELYKGSNDDSIEQNNELTSAITELRKLLSDATEQYGDLETQKKADDILYQQNLEEKENQIKILKDELKHANDLIKTAKEENLENAIGQIAPTAAVTNRLIKTDMSLTELYSKYVKSVEELEYLKKDKAKLDLHLRTILQELEENAPIIKKKDLEYHKMVLENAELTKQIESIMAEKVEIREELKEVLAKNGHYERENKKLKLNIGDLSRQVCFLLKEIGENRGNSITENDQPISLDMSANDVISKKLVTFEDICGLQENNQKLILLVRDLSSKLEELEEVQNNIDHETYEAKIVSYTKRLQDLQEQSQNQTKMMNLCVAQKERYKKLYHELLMNCGKLNPSLLDNSLNNDTMEIIEDENTPITSNSSVISNENIANKDRQINELEEKIKCLTDQIKKLKDEHEEYKKEKRINEGMMNDQFDKMRTELREITSKNCKLMSSLEYSKEQIKIQQTNVTTYKTQIAALEDRNRNYESTIVKYEQNLMHIKNEAFISQKKIATLEVQLQSCRQECRSLRDSEARLLTEREAFHRERQTNHIVLNNIEMIKTCVERSENEARQRIENRFDEATRECSALRRRLQEEQDHFREITIDLKRQTDTAKQIMEEEKEQAIKLRNEIITLRNQLTAKEQQIEDLSKKLQESLTPSSDDNPIAAATKKAREYELKFDEACIEIESLKNQLDTAKEHAQQYCKMSESSEIQLKDLDEVYTNYKTKCEEELKNLRLSELNLKSRIDELETEIQLQLNDAKVNTDTTQISKTQLELKEALKKNNENNREIRDLREKCNNLSSSLSLVEQKYANEMLLHSADIQEMTKTKDQLNSIQTQIDDLQQSRDRAIEVLEESKKAWAEKENRYENENKEIQQRLLDMDVQNSNLHDQIQELSNKLSYSNLTFNTSADDSLNESNAGDSSIINKSINEEDCKGHNQLLQIIKYLRKEKDIAIAKVDILKSENARLISEQNMLQKKLNDLNTSLNNERIQSEVVILTATKHEEILRRVETLNAVTDSNRILREDRDNLAKRVTELSERVNSLENEIFPIQEKNRELSIKIDEITAENSAMRIEATKWRTRANTLIERSNKHPEDFKRLQNERENLAKMLTAEQNSMKQLQNELTTIKQEKHKLEGDILNFQRQIQTLNDEKKKMADEYILLKQQNNRMCNELMETKNQLNIKIDEINKLTAEIKDKDSKMIDLKSKETQIRKIAKRYKDSYFELKTKEGGNELENQSENDTLNSDIAGISKQDIEKDLKEKLNELNNQIKNLHEQNEKLSKENVEMVEIKRLLKEARTRVMALSDSNNTTANDLSAAKIQIQNFEKFQNEHKTVINDIKIQYETKISRLEKAISDLDRENKDSISRLAQENNNLVKRNNQLLRQLGSQQVSKPSTSSGTGTDKGSIESPRTANVKPMSGPSGQQSATVTPWRGSETPLASIKPMSVQSRTAAILPTSQTSNVATVQGSSSASVTALVPPQQVHTTANSSGEVISSSPTSSHTDYMPATSSATVVVATIPPMGANAESSQEAESIQIQNNDSTSSSQALVTTGQQQQVVALVSPRVEGTSQNSIVLQSAQSQESLQPSTSGTTSSSNISVSNHHQASSSSTVTTTQAGHKRPRDIEGDSSTNNEETVEKLQPLNKRVRKQVGEVICQGVTESGIEIEYQVPTSSQRDQEDDIIVVDSDDEGMTDEGNADEDGQMEEETDNGEAYEMEESYEQEQDIDDADGRDIDEDNVPSDSNEAEVDEITEIPEQSANISSIKHVAPDAGTSQIDQTKDEKGQCSQQIQSISSGTEPGSSSQSHNWRPTSVSFRQQQASILLLQQGFDEAGDDSIVPSTPTLYAPRRADGFSEAVSSPHPQIPHTARFTFAESASSRQGEGIDDTRVDLSEDQEGRTVPSTPQQISPRKDINTALVEGSSSSEQIQQCLHLNQEPISNPSHSDDITPEILITTAKEEENEVAEGASTSAINESDKREVAEVDIEDSEGIDCVSSGEKPSGGDESVVIEEGREAEASTTPSVNTRSKAARGSTPNRRIANRIPTRGTGRPTPITWQDHSRHQNMNQNLRRLNDGNGQSRGNYQIQRGRVRRIRRPPGPNYGNMRY